MVLSYILIAVFIVSMISFVGMITLYIKSKSVRRLLPQIVSFAAGTMIAVSFFDLLPEAVEAIGSAAFTYVVVGLVAFFILEKFVFWYHCHGGQCRVRTAHQGHHKGHMHKKRKAKPVAYLNLIGDGLHNFIDGAIITSAFLTSIPLGIITTLAVIFHEIPQEIGDFSILLYGGFSRFKALMFNFLSALAAFLGALLAYYFGTTVQGLVGYLLAFAAGSFVYIAATDLLPELHHEEELKRNAQQIALFLAGIAVIWLAGAAFPY